MANITPIPIEFCKIGFIGAGKMAESIARGVVKSGVLPASQIKTAHLGTARRTAFESFGVKVFEQNSEVFFCFDYLILPYHLSFQVMVLVFESLTKSFHKTLVNSCSSCGWLKINKFRGLRFRLLEFDKFLKYLSCTDNFHLMHCMIYRTC